MSLKVPLEENQEKMQGHWSRRSRVNEVFVWEHTQTDQVSGENQHQSSIRPAEGCVTGVCMCVLGNMKSTFCVASLSVPCDQPVMWGLVTT